MNKIFEQILIKNIYIWTTNKQIKKVVNIIHPQGNVN